VLRVATIGFNEFTERINRATKEVQSEVAQEVAAAAALYEAGAIKTLVAQDGDTGTLAKSINKKQINAFEWDVFVGAFYAPFIEFGTKGKYRPIPGTEDIAAQYKGMKRGNFEQMLKNIEAWVKRKGIVATFSVKTQRRQRFNKAEANRTKQAAYAIAVSILKNGISPKPFFFQQIPVVRTSLLKNVERVLNGV
jgi:hypothetical protein